MTDTWEPVFGSIETGPGAALLSRILDLHAKRPEGSTLERAWVDLPPVGKPAPSEFYVALHGGVVLRCAVTEVHEPVKEGEEWVPREPVDDGAEMLPFFD